MIVRGRVVVTMDGPPIDNGAVVIAGDRIADVGRFSEIRERHAGERVIDVGEQALLPGLINAHCHLDYTCLGGRIPRQKSFTEWIRAINGEKAQLSPEDYFGSINDGFSKAKQFGTTSIANLTGFPELIARVEPPIRTWWFAELIDVRDPSQPDELIDLATRQLKSQENWGLAPHAPFTASADLYRRCEEIAKSENILVTTHLAESLEEMAMFRDAAGALYDFLKEIGRDMSDCGGRTPLSEFVRRVGEQSSPHWILVHMNQLSDDDFGLLKKAPPNISVVHCPRSHAYFRHSLFQFDRIRALNLNICLGTDSLASNDDLSLFAEMRAFQKEFPDVRSADILKMVTVNSARALRQETALGKVRPDFFADLIAVPIEDATAIFDELIGFDGAVQWLMVGGRVSA